MLCDDRLDSIVASFPYKSPFPPVITENEWRELQLDRLVKNFDRTKTSLGKWGLSKLLEPVADRQEIMRRQSIIAFLVENPDLLSDLQKELMIFHKSEDALFSYWDEKDQLNSSCDLFYYHMPFAKHFLNNSSLALNASVVGTMVYAGKGLVVSLCMHGLINEFNSWLAREDKQNLHWLKGIKRGIEEPLRQHSFDLYVLKNRNSNAYSAKDYIKAFFGGSFGDRYTLLAHGYSYSFIL
jgi:hypothetical protein